ncbi:MAG: type II toxin-antitoxin system VapC family toxin [Nostoc sp. DedQUE08]|uniref:type II toxin-antitoxin system VapC family toxin n=1 Tax=unclassified Nostoc TaxID=2593658 RepID=UPI002AD40E25|nr:MULTISPECIES: type II toxin-antitoxin system VapC family toxin [unclassified Nostoc]MDZ8070638.1 type II toxin-antitoxin system VapC family toxin [Nostoc sp. DedQUE08]MDZ8094509.1 type II toxin-antitoxin system VapC family toxin [Nostoc sp. DedQUE05]
MLLDSNIIIYSAQLENAQLRELIAEYAPAVSALSYLEVLGYHLLKEEQRQYFEEFFQVAQVLPISQDVLNQAVILRQQKRMTLGDAIIAATALVYGLTLITRNTDDFRWITQVRLWNPFESDKPS